MKHLLSHLIHAGAAAAALATLSLQAAQEKPAPREEKKELRVISGPDARRRPLGPREGEKREMETVTFLGVETSPVAPTLSMQLGLAPGTGLVIEHVAPESPAAGVLQEHDLLLQLDDQILIEGRQLSVLIRNHKAGDEVALTYMRGGKKTTAKVKLGSHEVPKMAGGPPMMGPSVRAFAFGPNGDERREFMRAGPDGPEGHADWDRVLSLLQRARPAPDGPPGTVPPGARIRIDHNGTPGMRAMSINAGNSNLLFSDEAGTLELTMKDGAKSLVAKDKAGTEIFSGPVTTPEERRALPPGVRERLEKLEGMQDMTFRTDGDFKGGEMRIMRPRSISLPDAPREAAPNSTYY
jgi:serine protease Do